MYDTNSLSHHDEWFSPYLTHPLEVTGEPGLWALISSPVSGHWPLPKYIPLLPLLQTPVGVLLGFDAYRQKDPFSLGTVLVLKVRPPFCLRILGHPAQSLPPGPRVTGHSQPTVLVCSIRNKELKRPRFRIALVLETEDVSWQDLIGLRENWMKIGRGS